MTQSHAQPASFSISVKSIRTIYLGSSMDRIRIHRKPTTNSRCKLPRQTHERSRRVSHMQFSRSNYLRNDNNDGNCGKFERYHARHTEAFQDRFSNFIRLTKLWQFQKKRVMIASKAFAKIKNRVSVSIARFRFKQPG